jgi:hypothetical protein
MCRQQDVVVVCSLNTATRQVTGTVGAVHPPRVGDQGAVLAVIGANIFQVECVDSSGRTRWLADFEPLSSPLSWVLGHFTSRKQAPGRTELLEQIRAECVLSRSTRIQTRRSLTAASLR